MAGLGGLPQVWARHLPALVFPGCSLPSLCIRQLQMDLEAFLSRK